MRGHGGQTNRSALGEGFRIVEDIDPSAITTNKKAEQQKNAFEIDLANAQQVERAKSKLMK
ncbi:MAG: hypothetical protein B0W54_18540 [Cellvibrio sp. 79]|nr:MAG: hypothetical protein B0W54_18540 [Cellvibrio sp. 79]